MSWYQLLKFASSYTAFLLNDLKNSGIFKGMRFGSYFANGSFGIFQYQDGELYEVRIEDPRHPSSFVPAGGKAIEIIGKLENSGLFTSTQQSSGGFIGWYQPDSLKYKNTVGVTRPEQYLIRVTPYKNSQHAGYFESEVIPK